MLGQQKAEAPAKPEKAAAASSWWWPFGGEQKSGSPKVAKVDVKATQAWLDQYEPRLREAVKDSKLEVERRENVLVVTLPVDVSFNPDRPSMLLAMSLGPITKVAKLVEGDTKTAVLVLGHADTSGKDETNRKISQERAQSVAAIFRLSGLQRDRLSLKGVGSDMPRAANDSQQGRSLNRRVEMVLTPQETLVALIAQYNKPAKPEQSGKAEQVVAADQTK
ncbi:putative outer membrane protein [Metapseudomonas resinovorans NBRC 106553]|uniref:Putative outer membrane protein n=1 Tax=Metapseudomonas resinovorans NBRC 106553 TaxID=1245471 RepID=S6AGR0_METRE|nr:putative outer membrane protein [Pseudomonas resinovorans NBRC 106553]